MNNLAAVITTVSGQLVPHYPPGLWPFVNFLRWAVLVLMIVSLWKVFTKAGQPGWAAIIPIYSSVILFRVAGKPGWWVLALFLPLVLVFVAGVFGVLIGGLINLVIWITVLYNLAGAFGKGIGFMLGLFFLPFIFFPILAFGKAEYLPLQTRVV